MRSDAPADGEHQLVDMSMDGILPEGSVADTTFTEFDGLRLRRSLRDQMKGYKYTFDILALKSQNK
jgi:hypothetical protein